MTKAAIYSRGSTTSLTPTRPRRTILAERR